MIKTKPPTFTSIFLLTGLMVCTVFGDIAIPNAKWWRDAKFGMFIHWGMASMYDNNQGGDLSWCRPGKRPLDNGGESVGAQFVPSYDTLYRRFNPTAFNADSIVTLAQRAGVRYIVPTTKHHEGFAMWDTRQKNSRDSFVYGVMSTPWQTDYVKLLSDACHKQNMDLGFYYSPRDWYNPDYGVGDNSVYESYMKGQINEILSNYGKIKIMWWDSFGHGDEISFWHSDIFQQLARTLQPSILCNDRSGSFVDGYSGGDFFTPEQEINPDFSYRLWESCMTMNKSWGYTASDKDWKSANELIKNLVTCTINNGNFLLNIGPKYDGSLEQEAIDRLKVIGEWTSRYGESIYGTRPWISRGNWGGTMYKGNTIYVHLTSWTGTVTISPTSLQVVSSRSLNGGTPTVSQSSSGITISLPSQYLDTIDNVIALEMDKPVIDTTPIKATDTIEAERFYDQFGQLRAEICAEGGENLGYIETANYALYKIDFGNGVTEFKARVAALANEGIIELRLDSASSPVFAKMAVRQTGSYSTYATQLVTIANGASIKGVHDLYVVFGAGCNLNWFTFTGGITGTAPPQIKTMQESINPELSIHAGKGTLSISTTSRDNHSVRIVNCRGVTVREFDGNGKATYSIPRALLPAGIYLVTLKSHMKMVSRSMVLF